MGYYFLLSKRLLLNFRLQKYNNISRKKVVYWKSDSYFLVSNADYQGEKFKKKCHANECKKAHRRSKNIFGGLLGTIYQKGDQNLITPIN